MIDIYILANNKVTLIAFESIVIYFVLNNACSSKIHSCSSTRILNLGNVRSAYKN